MKTKKNLQLNVKSEYFDDVKSGIKGEEYRVFNDYWSKRLNGVEYYEIHYKKGYPKRGDMSKTLIFPYKGYTVRTITHKHFGQEPVKVFAILLETTNTTKGMV